MLHSLTALHHVYISWSSEDHMLWENLPLTCLQTQTYVHVSVNESNMLAGFGVCDSGIT